MAATGLTPIECRIVKAPRVKESPINLECKHYQTIVLANDTPGLFNSVVIGRVVGVHIHDYLCKCRWQAGYRQNATISPNGLSRLYVCDGCFSKMRPKGISDDKRIRGMSGGQRPVAK